MNQLRRENPKISHLEKNKALRKQAQVEEQLLMNRLNYLKKQDELQWQQIKQAGVEALKYINYAKEKEAKQLRRNQRRKEHDFKISVVQ